MLGEQRAVAGRTGNAGCYQRRRSPLQAEPAPTRRRRKRAQVSADGREDADDERSELHAACPSFLPEEHLSCPILPTSAAVSRNRRRRGRSFAKRDRHAPCYAIASTRLTLPMACLMVSGGRRGTNRRRPGGGRGRTLTGSITELAATDSELGDPEDRQGGRRLPVSAVKFQGTDRSCLLAKASPIRRASALFHRDSQYLEEPGACANRAPAVPTPIGSVVGLQMIAEQWAQRGVLRAVPVPPR